MRYAIIMAGGSGTRLWPLSHQGSPKQLLSLFEGRSLLQMAWDRACHLVPAERLLVCTGAAYADDVRAQLPDLLDCNLLGEPTGRDSLNAAAWPAAMLLHRDPDAVMAVLTADHLISPEDVFAARVGQGFELVEADGSALVTFGVVPTSPNTGYGYLERGPVIDGFEDAAAVVNFTEKPNAELAASWVASGNYWWNSGMFVWRASTFMEQVRLLQPATHQALMALADDPSTLGAIYPGLTRISIDYAVMEPVSCGRGNAHVVAVGLPINWNDVGSFSSLHQVLPQDERQNAEVGRVLLMDADGNLAFNQGEGVLALIGVTGLAVVRTADATLVVPLEQAQKVKDAAALAEH